MKPIYSLKARDEITKHRRKTRCINSSIISKRTTLLVVL
jgi:hypothetical protein